VYAEQIRRNLVALISLAVALTALLYNTWRNEETEYNWNVRVAGFEMLVTLGELQRTLYLNHYDGDTQRGNPRHVWVQVMVLRDLGGIMPAPLPRQSVTLLKAWEENWQALGRDQAAADDMDRVIEETRQVVLQVLRELR